MSDSDTALNRFDTMSRYYSFETAMYWTRSHFFMVANIAWLAFLASRLFRANNCQSPVLANDGLRIWRRYEPLLIRSVAIRTILDR
jgi:hypothetical protein